MNQQGIETSLSAVGPAAVEALSRDRNEPTWLRNQRLAALATYESLPLPTLRDEEWRRTDIRGIPWDQLRLAAERSPASSAVDQLPAAVRAEVTLAGQTGGLVVTQDGAPVYQQVAENLARQGVVFSDLHTALRDHSDLLQQHLGQTVGADSKFSALNLALWTTGAFLYVPRRVEVALPLHTIAHLSAASQSPFFRTLIVVESDADVVLVDQWLGPTGEAAALSTNVQEVVVGSGSRVRYVTLQEWGRHLWNFSVNRSRLGRDSTVNSLVIAFGSRFHKANVESLLQGPGASAEMLGVLFGDSSQLFDHHTLQDHQAPHTSSDLLYKGALTDKARSVFSGMIHARKQAQKTDAIQTNRNLLLSDNSSAHSIPNLEIEANDLRCTHAATVAPVDDEQMFYLQARGLRENDAKRAIVEGFFEPVLERIPLPGIVERLRTVISSKIGD